MFDDNDDFYNRDLFMMSEAYRDATPDWVFPELNYLKDEDEEYWNRDEEETPVLYKSDNKEKYNYYESEEYRVFEENLDNSWVKKVKYWTKFYNKHKALNFFRNFLFWVPRNYKNAPSRIKERAEKEISMGI